MDGFLSNWLQTLLQENQPVSHIPGLRCPQCQMNWMDFRRGGRLGCPQCYEVFQQELHSVIAQIQGSLEHTGKIPAHQSKKLAQKKKLLTLQNQMQKYVEEQNFEKAAELRDQIRDLETIRGDEL